MFVAEVSLTWKNRLLHLSCFFPVCIGNLLPIYLASVQVFIVSGWVTAFKLVELFLFELHIVKWLKWFGLICQPFRLLELSLLGFLILWHDYGVIFLKLFICFLDRLINFLTLFCFLVWNILRSLLLGFFVVLAFIFGALWLRSFGIFRYLWNFKSPARCLRNQTRRYFACHRIGISWLGLRKICGLRLLLPPSGSLIISFTTLCQIWCVIFFH